MSVVWFSSVRGDPISSFCSVAAVETRRNQPPDSLFVPQRWGIVIGVLTTCYARVSIAQAPLTTPMSPPPEVCPPLLLVCYDFRSSICSVIHPICVTAAVPLQ